MALSSPVPYPQAHSRKAHSHKAGHVRTALVAITIAPVPEQRATAFVLNRTVNLKGVLQESTER